MYFLPQGVLAGARYRQPYYVGFTARRLAGASVPEASEGSLVPTMPAVSRLHLNEVETPLTNPTSHTAFQTSHRPAKRTTYMHTHARRTGASL